MGTLDDALKQSQGSLGQWLGAFAGNQAPFQGPGWDAVRMLALPPQMRMPPGPAAGPPMPTPVAPPEGGPAGIPSISTRAPMGGAGLGGGEKTFSFPAGPEMPTPPMLPAPPQVKGGGVGNYNGVRELADKGKPGAINQKALDEAQLNDILGGIAGGAGSVDATTGGSFAKALAMAGAGGSKAAGAGRVRQYEAEEKKDLQNQGFYQHRAGLEKDIISAQQTQAAHASEIAFRNAKLVYDTNVANQNAQYEYTLKKQQLESPQIKQDANGISISQMDPASRQWKVRYVPTKPMMDSLEKMENVFKAIGMPGEAAKAANIQLVGQQYAQDPIGGREVMKRMAVKDLIDSGAGSAVFGQAFQKAATAAKTELDAMPALQTKPAEYMSELNARIAARILNMPEVSTNLDWAVRGVAHSPYARALAGTK